MNRYVMIHRLRGPAILLLIGVLALLHQMGAIPHFWRLFWPLLLILIGGLLLAERAALASEGYPMFAGWPWQGAAQGPAYQGTASAAAGQGAHSYTESEGGAIVPSETHDAGKDWNGGQS